MSDVEIRDATEHDLDATVALIAAHRGGDVAEWRQLFDAALDDDARHFVVAVVAGSIVGFGHTKRVEARPADDAPPAGWFLSGVTVAPDVRRRGIGTALTRVRLDRLRGLTDVVYYAAEPDNEATVALHAPFGFVFTGQRVAVPGADRLLDLHRLEL